MTREELEKRRKQTDQMNKKALDMINKVWDSPGIIENKASETQTHQLDVLSILIQGVLDELKYMNDKEGEVNNG